MQRHPVETVRQRRGYTLLELLLAVVVLAILAGVTVPSALRMYGDTHLAEAAELVRSQVALARVQAIETGERYQFRYEPGGHHCVVLPLEFDANEATDEAMAGHGALRNSMVILPQKVRFRSLVTDLTGQPPAGQSLPPQLFAGLPNAGDLASLAWSPPIIFASDGSAIDGSWAVVDERGQGVPMDVRGLTGGITIGRMQPMSER